MIKHLLILIAAFSVSSQADVYWPEFLETEKLRQDYLEFIDSKSECIKEAIRLDYSAAEDRCLAKNEKTLEKIQCQRLAFDKIKEIEASGSYAETCERRKNT